jgi:MoaA/NifB/PqqE/SkfB family radical SAM enzyme
MTEIQIKGHKLWWHFDRVEEFYKTEDSRPVYVEVGLTNRCNYECSFCGLDWARGKDTLETNVLMKNIKDMAKFGVKSICYSGAGEPTLHKNFSKIIQETKKSGIDVSLSTNTVLFDKNKSERTLPYLSWIRFSVSSASPETHLKIHGTKNKNPKKEFYKILDNLKNSVELKTKNNYDVVLGVQFLLLDENCHEAVKMAEICKNIGVDNLQIKPYVSNSFTSKNICIDYSKFSDLENKLKEFSDDKFKVIWRTNKVETETQGKKYDTCYGLPFMAVINEKGHVQPCIHNYDVPNLSYGNIHKNLFSEIWRGNQRKNILKTIKKAGVKNCKKGCRLDRINEDLNKLMTGEMNLEDFKTEKNPPLHVNFI